MSLTSNTRTIEELLEMANNLPDAGGGGTDPVIEALSVTENGTYTAPDGVDGYSPVTVNVPVPDGYIVPNGELEVTENGTHDVTEYASVNVNVAASSTDPNEIARTLVNKSITAYSDSEVTTIGAYAFYNCTKLTEVDAPAVTSIGAYAFQGSAVSHLSFPNVTGALTINSFRNATSLTTVDLPEVTNITNGSIYGCTALKSATFPKVTFVGSAAMYGCTALEYVDLPVCATITERAFYNCTALTTLILRNTDAVCTLGNTNSFTASTIASGTGYIYVPSALVDSYKAATNWSTFADQIRALEDYTVDGTTTGELDETKI